ncbi:MAG: sensor histidine kinase [Desulfuromonadales bacterium]|nr:sensor histidine kinase [Desulfuromonadales bacterium]
MPDQERSTPRHSSPLARRLFALSPNQLLAIMAVIIFAAEILDMLLINLLPRMGDGTEALLDSCILLVILSPAYFFLYRPFWQERQRSEAEIRRLSRQLIRGEEATRKTLARELHDEFGQTLGAVQLGIETLKNSLPAGHVQLDAQCQRLSLMIAQLGAHVRDVTAQLRPAMIDNLGLVPTLHWHLEQFRLSHPEIRVIINLTELEINLPGEIALAVYRVCQESLNNVAKHAQASRVGVDLLPRDGQLTLTVEDDGVGFEPDSRREVSSGHPPGIGISGMRERIADAGGSLQIRSWPGGGTVVMAVFPLTSEAAA